MLRSFTLAALIASAPAFAQTPEPAPGNNEPKKQESGGKLKSTVGITGPNVGRSPVNANGTPVSDRGVTTNIDGKPVNNLSGGTNVNPYTGVPVGQPMHPNDLGSPEAAPRR